MKNVTEAQFREAYPMYKDVPFEMLKPKLAEKGVNLTTATEDALTGARTGILNRGVAGVLGTPGAIMNTAIDAGEWLTGTDTGVRFDGYPEWQKTTDEALNVLYEAQNKIMPQGAQVNTQQDSSYRPATVTGRAAQLAGEMLPAAAGAGAMSAAARTPAALAAQVGMPTVTGTAAGEAARQVAPEYEDIARGIGAAVGGLGGAAASRVRRPHVDPSQQTAVQAMRRQGIEPSAGQALDDLTIRNIEGATKAGSDLQAKAHRSFGDIAIQKAVPDAIRHEVPAISKLATYAGKRGTIVSDALDETGAIMSDLAERNNIPIRRVLQDSVDQVVLENANMIGAGAQNTFFYDIADDIRRADVMDGKEFQRIRSKLSKFTTSTDEGVRKTAIDIIEVIDAAMDQAISEKGNVTDMARYRAARSAYRDLLTLDHAHAKAGPRASGHITAADLDGSVKTREGTRALNGSRSTFSELTDYGREALGTPRTTSTPEQSIAKGVANAAIPGSLTALAATQMGVGNAGAIALGVGSAVAPKLRNMATASKAGQAMLKRGFKNLPDPYNWKSSIAGAAVPATRPWWEEDEKRR